MGRISDWVRKEPYWVFGLLLGFLPVLAGLIFRTYTYNVAPVWFENLRQIDALFVVFEIAVIIVAREIGMKYLEPLRELNNSTKLAALVFFLTFWWSSIFVSQMPALAIFKAMAWIVHFTFGLSVYYLSKNMTIIKIEAVSRGLFWGLCAYTPILFLHFYLAPLESEVHGGRIVWASALPGYLSVRLLGFYTTALAVLALGLLWSRQQFRRADVWLYSMLGLSFVITFWSGTRSGVYAILIVSAAAPILFGRFPTKLWIGSFLIASIGAFWLSEQLFQPSHEFGLLRLGGNGGSSFVTGRDIIWTFAVEKIIERPLFGWGEAAIVWLHESGAFYQQPHNALLQMLLHWGAIATVSVICILALITKAILSEMRQIYALQPLVAVLLALTVMSMVDGILYHPRITIFVVLTATCSLAIIRDSRCPPSR